MVEGTKRGRDWNGKAHGVRLRPVYWEDGNGAACGYGKFADTYGRCRVSGTELVRLLLETADPSPPYYDVSRYGAGLVTLERSVRACG